jgi:hypothetical protein
MTLRETNCPHCFREVFVNTDAICPACQGNVDDKSLDHENLTPVEFVDGEELPPICVVCGNTSKYYVKVGEKNEAGGNDGVGVISRLLGAIGGLIAIRFNPEPHVKEYKISVKLPVCESHRESRMLKPISIDYRRYRIAIPAHRDFIQRWKKA